MSLNIWFDGNIGSAQAMTAPLTTHALHYGTGVFEGIRSYATRDGAAVFRLGDQPRAEVCSQALNAAAGMRSRVRKLNATRRAAGEETMELDVALHLGDVLYGNVGAADRLDFTVVGPAVNEASRIEPLCKRLGRDILVSETFARAATNCAHRLNH